MSESSAPAPAGKLPARALFIVGNEACERFSFYGMSAVLTLYMTGVLRMSDDDATAVSHIFKSAVYFLPLLGAIIADRWLGRYRTIVSLSGFYCLGHAALAIWEGTPGGLYLGLGLIALGAGGIKPCVSAFVGDQFAENDKAGLAKVYGMFYWAINFGSFFAFAIIPWLRDNYGYSWAFGVPGIFMGLALIVFLFGSKTYTRVPPAGRTPGFFAVAKHCLRSPEKTKPFWERARGAFPDELIDGSHRVAGVLGLFSVIPVFWALFDQTSTTWILQGKKMTPVDITLPFLDKPWKLAAESMQSANPLFVMLLIPLCTLVAYPLAEKLGARPAPLRRMTLGMALAALAFVASAWLQHRLESGESLSILWQTLPYLLLTLGEVLFSTTGLEFAFTQAPKSMKSTLMSFWTVTVSVGNLLVATLAHWGSGLFGPAREGEPAPLLGGGATAQFLFYAVLMAVVTGLFVLLGRRYLKTHGMRE